MSASREIHSTIAARGVIGDMVRPRGLKRGLHDAAIALGVSERVVKAIAYGEAARTDARVVALARLTLAEQRLAQLEAEAKELRGLVDASRGYLAVAR